MRKLAERDDAYRLYQLESLEQIDAAALVEMIDGAWRHDYVDEARLDFDATVLAKMMRPPWFVAVVAVGPGGGPVGFEIALERRLRFGDETRRAFYATSFSVSEKHRRRGLGRWILEGINRLVFDESGADLIVSTFHEGYAGSPTVQSTFDAIGGWGVVRFHSSPILRRRLDKHPMPTTNSPLPVVRLVMRGERPGDGLAFDAPLPGSPPVSLAPPSAAELDELIRRRFTCSFSFDESLGCQYLHPGNAASRSYLYDLGSGAWCLACVNVCPMAINDHRLRPVAQLQLVLVSGGRGSDLRSVLEDLGRRLGEEGCMALSLVDMGMVPRSLLEELDFEGDDDRITFAVRGPRSSVEIFDGAESPFFVDFT